MKSNRIFVLMFIIVAILVTSTAVFAEQTTNVSPNTISTKDAQSKEKLDPIQRMEKMKDNIQKKVTDGKITQQEANDIKSKIDQKIKEMQAFNKLPVSEKKDKLIRNFTAKVNEKVKNNKLTQPEADKALTDFKAAIDKWDGTGYPPFLGKGIMKGGGHCHKHKQDMK